MITGMSGERFSRDQNRRRGHHGNGEPLATLRRLHGWRDDFRFR